MGEVKKSDICVLVQDFDFDFGVDVDLGVELEDEERNNRTWPLMSGYLFIIIIIIVDGLLQEMQELLHSTNVVVI